VLWERVYVAGPNPHKLHSFAELRAMFGPLWVRCDRCRRFRQLRVTRALRDRDHRHTRFRCRHCGGQGWVALERPNTEPGMENYADDDRPAPFDQAATHARLRSLLPWWNDAEWAWRFEPDTGPPTENDAYRRRHAPANASGDLSIWMLGASAEQAAVVNAWLVLTLNPARIVPATHETHRIQGRSRPGGHGNTLP
jgi:hypothetical protein